MLAFAFDVACGCIAVSSLIGGIYLIMEYSDHQGTSDIKIKFRQFAAMYAISPQRWRLSKYECCYFKGSKKYWVYFSFVGYWRYRNFMRRMRKAQYMMEINKQEKELLKLFQEDIEWYKTASLDEQIKMFANMKRDQYRHEAFLNIKHL